ncbi:TIGR03668 family PPOX class F420-dependent oxidoreductase [Frankia sp. AvcI1]|uniref:TIGR03668 family PPOX class F420-dependent oxidoreductase n=1 Tax=Frankia sp. AvcI1 TaxID=573496 RepID=UPI002118CB9E|nr:TIGR03668 family PPOX class F420-dependent oxidoreductase [Frankia sp. AvcI1]
MRLSALEARRRFAGARVARLATAGADGQPLVVPVTFAVEAGDAPVEAGDAPVEAGGTPVEAAGEPREVGGAGGGADPPVTIVTIVDHKPKSTSTGLRRLRNIHDNPLVSLLVDHYDDDWARLWWARADGLARILEVGNPRHAAAVAALSVRYRQYRQVPPTGPAILVAVTRWSGWSYSASPAAL